MEWILLILSTSLRETPFADTVGRLGPASRKRDDVVDTAYRDFFVSETFCKAASGTRTRGKYAVCVASNETFP